MTLFSRERSLAIVSTLMLVAVALAVASAVFDRSAYELTLGGPERSMRWVLPVAQVAVMIPVLHAPGRLATTLYILVACVTWMYTVDPFGSMILDAGDVTMLRFHARTYAADVLLTASVSFQTVALPWAVAMARQTGRKAIPTDGSTFS